MKKINENKNNKKFNATINKVHEEMMHVENNIRDWNVKWDERYSVAYCYDLQYLLEEDIAWLESMYEGKYDLTNAGELSSRVGAALKRETLVDEKNEEYEVEFRKVEWNIKNSKIGRYYSFLNNGDICYSQLKRNRKAVDESFDYYSKYNVNNNDLFLHLVSGNNDVYCVFSGDSRVIDYNGVSIVETSDDINVLFDGRDSAKMEVSIKGDKVDTKTVTIDDEVYVLCNGEIIKMFRVIDGKFVDVELNDELVDRIKKSMLYEFGVLKDEDILEFVKSAKDYVIKAIKFIKKDVTLDGLSKRMDIALSMVNTKIVKSDSEKTLKKN